MRRLIIIGAGGHGRVAADIADSIGYTDISFLDDGKTGDGIIGGVSDFEDYIESADFFVAIGNNAVRRKISLSLLSRGARVVNLVHRSAVIGRDVTLGRGVVMMANTAVNNGARIGDGVIINTAASVDHDCVIGDYSHISVGAHLAGSVTVGEECFVCAGATVINNVSIPGGCTVGAGAAVIRDITEQGVYVGVPAKKIK